MCRLLCEDPNIISQSMVVIILSCSLQNGLMVAVASGYVDIVYALHVCPLIDINHQDADGNTALMIAAQAGNSVLSRPLSLPI